MDNQRPAESLLLFLSTSLFIPSSSFVDTMAYYFQVDRSRIQLKRRINRMMITWKFAMSTAARLKVINNIICYWSDKTNSISRHNLCLCTTTQSQYACSVSNPFKSFYLWVHSRVLVRTHRLSLPLHQLHLFTSPDPPSIDPDTTAPCSSRYTVVVDSISLSIQVKT